jgi:helix-turn-helix protein
VKNPATSKAHHLRSRTNFPLVTDLTAADHSIVEWPGRIGPGNEVTLGEAAELLGLAPGRVRELVEADLLPARTDTSVTRISRADVEINRLRAEAGAS